MCSSTATPRLAILTGAVRAGKTTAAQAIAPEAVNCGYTVGGFLSPDRRDSAGAKVGLDVLRVADGERRLLAQIGPASGLGPARGPVVGPYAFDQECIDWALAAFAEGQRASADLLFADELGRLEFERGQAFAPLLDVLRAGDFRRVLAVVRLEYVPRLAELPGVDVRAFVVEPNERSRRSMSDEAFRWLVAPSGTARSQAGRSRIGGCRGC